MDTLKEFQEMVEREYQLDREAIERIARRYPGYGISLVKIEEAAQLKKDVPAAKPAPDKPTQGGLSALEGIILAVVNGGPDREWTSRTMCDRLKTMDGVHIPAKDEAAMNAVGWALKNLAVQVKIRQTHVGKGRDPHRYQALRGKEEGPAE